MSTAPDEHPDSQLADYSVGALPAAQRLSVERHLAACPRCRARLRSLQTTALLLHNLPVPDLPRTFTLSPDGARRRRSAGIALPISFLSAAAVLFLALGLSLALSRPVSSTALSSAAQNVPTDRTASAHLPAFGAAAAPVPVSRAAASTSAATSSSVPANAGGIAESQAAQPALQSAPVQPPKSQLGTPAAGVPPPAALVRQVGGSPQMPRNGIQAYQLLLGLVGLLCLAVGALALARSKRSAAGP